MIVDRPAWHTRAACRGLDPDLFHPQRDGTSTSQAVTDAKAVCRTCPVRWTCLHDHLEAHPTANHDDLGVWGGTTVRERRAIRADRGRQAIVAAGADLEQRAMSA